MNSSNPKTSVHPLNISPSLKYVSIFQTSLYPLNIPSIPQTSLHPSNIPPSIKHSSPSKIPSPHKSSLTFILPIWWNEYIHTIQGKLYTKHIKGKVYATPRENVYSHQRYVQCTAVRLSSFILKSYIVHCDGARTRATRE